MSIKEMKTFTVGDTTYEIVDGKATHYAVVDNPDCHAEYFTIDDDGVVALKPEYRGATNKADYIYDISDMGVNAVGSKNAELPKNLIIPEIVDDKAVCSLALAIFRYNLAVENITLPSTITELSARCFDGCANLKNVYNTENIKSVGQVAFQNTRIERIKLPNLEQFLSTSTFQNCGSMVYSDIGKVTALPDKTFNNCVGLNMVKNSGQIASVGSRCFNLTPNLKHADLIQDLTNIGEAAFMRSGVDYNWDSLTNCTFAQNATPSQYSPTDFWSQCSFTPCENPLPTLLFQDDARWKTRQIGTSGCTYNDGCGLLSLMHIYCGLHNISISTVMEFEEIVNNIDPNWLNSYTLYNNDLKRQAENLGLTVERYCGLLYDGNGEYDATILQKLYDALADGKYVIFLYNEPTITTHYVVIYGINNQGDFLMVNSLSLGRDICKPHVLSVSKLGTPEYHNAYRLHIVSL